VKNEAILEYEIFMAFRKQENDYTLTNGRVIQTGIRACSEQSC